jgi:hypothetical protein
VERLVQFYCHNFGLNVTFEPDPVRTVLDTGAVQFAFHKIGEQFLTTAPEQFRADSNVKRIFRVENDLASFRQKLLSNRVDVDAIKQFPGANYRVCDGSGPEGNVFQLVQYNT